MRRHLTFWPLQSIDFWMREIFHQVAHQNCQCSKIYECYSVDMFVWLLLDKSEKISFETLRGPICVNTRYRLSLTIHHLKSHSIWFFNWILFRSHYDIDVTVSLKIYTAVGRMNWHTLIRSNDFILFGDTPQNARPFYYGNSPSILYN